MIFYTLHATRVVCHMAKVKGNNIAICKAIIPPSDLARYQAIRGQSTKSAAARKKAREDIDDFIDDRLDGKEAISLVNDAFICHQVQEE